MVSSGMTCVKYLLFCFNLLFVISGIVIISVGAIIQASFLTYSDFVDSSFSSAPIILIVVGVVVFAVAFFGCCGALKENHCMIITFSVFLLIIFTLELAAGIAGYMRRNEVNETVKEKLNDTLYKYNSDINIQKSWNVVQHDFECCGVHNSSDWHKVFQNDTLPHSCCFNISSDEICNIKSDYYHDGCLEGFEHFVEKQAYVIGAVGIAVAIIQLLGVAFACSLARSIRKEYETV